MNCVEMSKDIVSTVTVVIRDSKLDTLKQCFASGSVKITSVTLKVSRNYQSPNTCSMFSVCSQDYGREICSTVFRI